MFLLLALSQPPFQEHSWAAAKGPFYPRCSAGLFFAVCGRLFVLFCPSALPIPAFLIKSSSSGNWILSPHLYCLLASSVFCSLNACLDYLLQFQPHLFRVSSLFCPPGFLYVFIIYCSSSYMIDLAFLCRLLEPIWFFSFCQVFSAWLLHL